MQLIRRLETAHPRDCVVTIGSFDGLHLGHRALIERALYHAAQRQVPAMMVSFEPLPRDRSAGPTDQFPRALAAARAQRT
jgi:riboflavin kinase/FMN adenylyltransferase